jgi:hypothetical protein
MESNKLERHWISGRYFSAGCDFAIKVRVSSLFGTKDWKYAYDHLSERRTISPNALKLALKIKEELGIEVFPLINVTATKGYMDAGCAVFMMYSRDGYYLFDDETRKYLLKKSKLITYNIGGDEYISIETKIKP